MHLALLPQLQNEGILPWFSKPLYPAKPRQPKSVYTSIPPPSASAQATLVSASAPPVPEVLEPINETAAALPLPGPQRQTSSQDPIRVQQNWILKSEAETERDSLDSIPWVTDGGESQAELNVEAVLVQGEGTHEPPKEPGSWRSTTMLRV